MVVNFDDDTVSMLLNDGSGLYAPPVAFATGVQPRSLAVADFNGDNIPDVATSNTHTDGDISILLGDGKGGLLAPVSVPTPGPLRAIRAGDLNRDGVMDLAVTDFAPPGVTVLLGIVPPVSEFTSPPGEFSKLVKNGDGSFTRTLENGTVIEFDSAGLMTSVTDRNGNATTYRYDGSDRLTSVTDPMGLITTLAYGAGQVTITDPAARVTTLTVDGNGDLSQIQDPDLTTRNFTYDAEHVMETKTSKRGFATSYLYDFAGANTQANLPDSSTRLLSPSRVVGLIDTSGGLGTEGNPAPISRPEDVMATFTDGNNHVTTFELDKFGGTLSRTDALGRNVSFVRDGNGNTTQSVAPNGAITEFTYDARGNVIAQRDAVGDPLERESTFEYEPTFNLITKITEPGPDSTTFNYDANGNLIEVIDAASTRTTLAYADPNCPGLMTSQTQAVGLPEESTVTFIYDAITCDRTQTIDPLGNNTVMEYDSAGNMIGMTDAELRVSRTTYDAMNRRVKVIDATNSNPDPACGSAGVTCFAHDGVGNLISITDANGNVTTFDYDVQNRLIAQTDPLLNVETRSYDDQGNLRFITDREGQIIEFQYDDGNRRIAKIMEPGTANEVVRGFGYDLAGNLTSLADADSALTMGYDLLGRSTSTSTAGSPAQPSVMLTSTYDSHDNRLTLTDPTGQSTFIYDMLDRLTDITNPSLQSATVGYDALGRQSSVTLPNGVVTTLVYDADSRLLFVNHDFGPTSVASFAYGHDKVDNRTSLDQTRSAVTVTPALVYVYDSIDRLTDATNALPAMGDETFTYDPVGNRLNRDGQTADAIFGAANRLLEDDEFTYAYDLNGNLVMRTDKLTLDVTSYTYDAENRLARIDFPGGSFAAYRYDGIGRRIEKNVDGVIKRFVYDREDILLEYDGPGALVARYTHGPGTDQPLMMQRDLDVSGTFDAGESFYYHADDLGSIIDITDENGAVVRAYVYDSYGTIISEAGTLESPFTYTGREFDVESGLYYYRARYYDPRNGRFITEDPIGHNGGPNHYIYAIDNPIRFVDPSGLSGKDIVAMLDLAIVTQRDLPVPGRIGVINLWGYDGMYIPFTMVILLDVRFEAPKLGCPDITQLFRTIVHESIHKREGGWDAFTRPLTHPDIYNEADRRTRDAMPLINKYCENQCG